MLTKFIKNDKINSVNYLKGIYKMNYKFRNSQKNNFAVNLLLLIIAAVFVFAGAKVLGNKAAIIAYALSIAVSFCKIAVDAIEKAINVKIGGSLIATVAVLLMFASQKFFAASVVALVYAFSKVIFDYICSCFSDRILEDDENKLTYEVLDGENQVTIFADDLQTGDEVLVKQGDYLAFDYIYDKDGKEKVYSAGKFNASPEAVVKVAVPVPYEIDFEESTAKSISNIEKTTTIITNVYCILMIVVALCMFGIEIAKTGSVVASLYVLGTYLLFVNSLTLSSGNLFAGLFSLKNLKNTGVCLENTTDLEKLSSVKKIMITDEVVGETCADEDVVKAVKVADVLNIQTELVSELDENATSVKANAIGFNAFKSGVSEGLAQVVDAPLKKGAVAVVTSKEIETEKALVFGLNGNSRLSICKAKMLNLVKAIGYSKIYKWFVSARIAVGAAVNAVVCAVFASGKGAEFISKMLVETDETSTDGLVSTKAKILNALIENEMLAPWIIVAVHLVLINVLLGITIAFLNDNNKKLR